MLVVGLWLAAAVGLAAWTVCAFLLSGNPTIKQFGLGMAAAVAIDATLIRCALVPAVLALLGSATWRMPAVLARVTPPLSIEGEAWFAERDAAAAPEPQPITARPARRARRASRRRDRRSTTDRHRA